MAVAALAARQWGVTALSQLCGLGLTANGVRLRARAGHLHRIHRGVYAVGHRNLTPKGRLKAAELALGKSAAVSNRSAAALLEIRADNRSTVDVTVSNRRARSRPLIRVHQASLLIRDVTTVEGITCTAWPRTMLDLAAELGRDASDRALERTEILRPAPSRNELERTFLAICRRHRLPTPLVNTSLEIGDWRIEPDFLWSAHVLIAETDGAETHDTRTAFERDRRRDQRLAVAGYRVVRFTWRQVMFEPDRVASTLAALLRSSSSGRTALTPGRRTRPAPWSSRR